MAIMISTSVKAERREEGRRPKVESRRKAEPTNPKPGVRGAGRTVESGRRAGKQRDGSRVCTTLALYWDGQNRTATLAGTAKRSSHPPASAVHCGVPQCPPARGRWCRLRIHRPPRRDRKSTRLNSSHAN